MAVDTVSQRSILGIMQALFDATPGAGLNNVFSQVVEQGFSLPLLATVLTRTTAFNRQYSYASTLPVSTFASQFINDLVGSRATQANKNTLIATIVNQISTGMSRDEAMSTMFSKLLETSNDNSDLGAAAAYYKRDVVSTILTNLLGSSTAAVKLKTDLSQIMTDMLAKDGAALGSLVVYLTSALDTIPETDPTYGEIVQRFHNKLEVSGYYSLNLVQSAASMDELKSVISPVDASQATVALAKMKVDYFATHAPYAIDTMVITSTIDISGIDTAAYKNLLINAGTAESLPRATITMTAAQAVAFKSITKTSGDKLAIVDTIEHINENAGKLAKADSLIGLITASKDLSKTDLTRLTGLRIDDGTSAAVTVTVSAAQAAALFGQITKGSGDTLAVVDSIANINAVSNLSMADSVSGVVSTSTDLSTTDLSRLTALTIGNSAGTPVTVTMLAIQAEQLGDRIVKTKGASLTLYSVPSEISTLPDVNDAVIVNVTITRDLRSLDLSKCTAMTISDSTSGSIYATVLAKQAQSLSGRVTKGISDKLVVDDTPANVLAATDLSVADSIYATDLSGNNVTISEAELNRITGLRTAGKTTLTNATSAGLLENIPKISLSGGTLLVTAAAGNINVAMTTMASIASLTAQSGSSITLTDAKNSGLSGTIGHLHVSGGGQVNIIGATGENISMTTSDLASVGSLIAAANANLTLTSATDAGLLADLAKLHVSGTGKIAVSGDFNENFTISEGSLLPLKSLTANGTGIINVTGVHNANVATVLAVTAIAGTGSVSITGAALENLTVSGATLAAEPVSSVTAAADQNITLSDATAATLATDTAKLHISGTGKINILGATGQSLSFAEAALGAYGTVAATGTGNITITGVTTANLATDLTVLTVGSGVINLVGASGQALSLTHTQISGSVSITAGSGDSILLTGATGSTLTSDLGKLHVTGGGTIDVTGASNENLTLAAASFTNLSGLHATGTGNVTVTNATAANVETLLNKVSIAGTGTASLTFTDASTATVSAAAANNRKIYASDTNGSIEITNAAGKQTFYASPGTTGHATLITRSGDSTANTATCDVLNVVNAATALIDFSAISSNDLQWNVTTTGKATALSGTGLVLDAAKYDVYMATVLGSDYIVYETAVNGSTYEALKIVGTVLPAALQISTGILYL